MKNLQFKVVVFRAGSIGDCLMAKYFLENVRATHPDARCTIVVGERAQMIRGLLSSYPWIEVREVNRRKIGAIIELVKNFWRADLVVTQYTKGTFSLLSKIMARILAKQGSMVGFTDPWWGNNFVYSKLIQADLRKSTREHEVQILEAASIPVLVENLTFVPSREILALPLRLKPYLIVHLFPGNEGRGFTFENKVKIVTTVAKKYGATHDVVLTGGTSDADVARAVVVEILQRDNRLSAVSFDVVAGSTSLPQLIKLIYEAQAVISADTGVAHLAAHMSKKLIVLRSCVGRNWWLPGQYGSAPVVLEADSVCVSGHIGKIHPACINSIAFESINIPGLSIA